MKIYVRAGIIDPLEEERQTRFDLAKNPKTRLATLERLAHDPDDLVRGYVAANPATPLDLLESMIDSPGVRYEIARRDDVPDDFLRKYADEYEDFAWGLCRRIACTPEELAKFYELYNEAPHSTGLMMYIAKNPKTPPEVLDALGNYPDTASMVQCNVANNPNTSIDTLMRILINTPNWVDKRTYNYLANIALRNLEKRGREQYIDILAGLTTNTRAKIREIAASNTDTPESLLVNLTQDPSANVRKAATKTLNFVRRFKK